MASWTVSADGHVSAAGAAWAFVARADGEEVRRSGPLAGATSHLAEWIAASRALEWAGTALAAGDSLVLRVDSALVAKGLASRRPRMSGEAAALRAEARRMLARLAEAGVRVRVERVAREFNVEADAEAHEAVSSVRRRRAED